MRQFSELLSLVEQHHGGGEGFEGRLSAPAPYETIAAQRNDRWLAMAAKCVFQSGFSWSLIDKRWPLFEAAFDGFDLARWTLMHDEDVERLMKAEGIVANGAKIRSVGENARYFQALADEHGSVGTYFATWRIEDYTDNLKALRKGGSRLGGRTGQYMLRRMGVDTIVFSDDVLRALDREGVVSRMPVSAKDLDAVQNALDSWHAESGRSLTQISQLLALSVG